MANPDLASAGTARPDAALSDPVPDDIRIREIQNRLNDWREIRQSLTGDEDDDFPSDAEMALDAHAGDDIGWLLDRLAERDAECERLREAAARLDWLEARLLADPDFEITGQPDHRWPRFVLTNHPESAGIQRDSLREAIAAAKARWPDIASAPSEHGREETSDGR